MTEILHQVVLDKLDGYWLDYVEKYPLESLVQRRTERWHFNTQTGSKFLALMFLSHNSCTPMLNLDDAPQNEQQVLLKSLSTGGVYDALRNSFKRQHVDLLEELGIVIAEEPDARGLQVVELVPGENNNHGNKQFWTRVSREVHAYTPKLAPGLYAFGKLRNILDAVRVCGNLNVGCYNGACAVNQCEVIKGLLLKVGWKDLEAHDHFLAAVIDAWRIADVYVKYFERITHNRGMTHNCVLP
jgi:hypothetical protein